MDFFALSHLALWSFVLLNLFLTLRLVSWLRAAQALREDLEKRETLPELTLGDPAPEFSARTLAGDFISLQNYRGKATLFIFFSPDCFSCRQEMPVLTRLGAKAARDAGPAFVLVSFMGTAETLNWKRWLLEEDKVSVDLPILVAPPQLSNFYDAYNPRHMTPYHCLIDAGGAVRSRSPVGADQKVWTDLTRVWDGVVPLSRTLGRYR